MPKGQAPPALNLSAANSRENGLQPTTASTMSPRSPRSPRTPRSIPGSPYLQDFIAMGHAIPGSERPTTEGSQRAPANESMSPSVSDFPQLPSSPTRSSQKHARDPSKSFFSNLMASKSSHRLQSPERNGAESSEKQEKQKTKSRASSKDRFHSSKARGSTPDLPRTARTQEKTLETSSDLRAPSADLDPASGSDTVQPLASRRAKPRFGGLLSRTKSIRVDDGQRTAIDRSNAEPVAVQQPDRDPQYGTAMKSAPLRSDHRERTLRDTIGSSARNRSADRPGMQSQENLAATTRKDRPVPAPVSVNREGPGLLSNLHHTGRGVGDRLGKAGKGFFGKITRSGSSNERDLVTDDSYTCTVINMPLVPQTRKTRIARRLELSRDKTEFWMPALPWRCIDYLNMNGCEEEGLYRIPGSGKDVKHWQRRFDTEHDINLFDEPDLYDINTIGSMFKSWLRELPDEIFPKSVQAKIAEQCMGATETPQLLKDELSSLPPFNYYLLFAITCHLSLLHSFADKNKMDYRNLCICFQPCLKIDGFCFQFLVQDWKNCWQGCWTEKEYLEEEYRLDREGFAQADSQTTDDRAISSSDSGHQTQHAQPTGYQDVPRAQHAAGTREGLHTNGGSAHSAPQSNTIQGSQQSSNGNSRPNNRLPEVRPLSVIKM